MRRFLTRLSFAAVLAGPLGLGACTDRNPASAPDAAPSALPPSAMAMLTCTVSVRDGAFGCAPAEAAPSGVSAAVLGGQGSYVRLASTGIRLDSASGTFRADVTLENLTAQALGTANGATATADGIRVFFSSGPVATEGTGSVEVANADGEGTFTAAAQKFFRYEGILAPGDTSAAREWRFSVPATVERFTFGVYVAAAVPAEAGWLSLFPVGPTLPVGDTLRMSAVVRNLVGVAQGDTSVTWTTADSSVATVDAHGLLRGMSRGIATVTGTTGGGRTGRVRVHVYDDPEGGPSTTNVVRIQVEWLKTATGLDSVLFRAPYSGRASLQSMWVTLSHPRATTRECRATADTRVGDGVEYQCGLVFPETAAGGAWRIDRISVSRRTLEHADLVAAGAPGYIYVKSDAEDRTAPTLDSMVLVTPAVEWPRQLSLRFRATDHAAGTDRLTVWVRSQGNPRVQLPASYVMQEGGTSLFYLDWTVPQYYRGGTFTLDSVRVQDRNGNALSLGVAALAGRGFATQFTVTGTTPDTVPPTITGFAFSPDTIAGNGADPVTVTLSASEPASESGVWFLDMEFEKVNDPAQLRRCLLNGATRVFARTMTCTRTFTAADAGAWRVRFIRAIDFMDNQRVLLTADLTAAGYPTLLVVEGATPDRSPPAITAFSFSPRTVAGNGLDSVTLTLSASEPQGETGMYFADAVLERVSDPTQFRWCRAADSSAPRTLTITCREAFSAAEAGAWRVRYIRAIDVAYNTRALRNADLQAAGYPTDLTVTAP